MALASYEETSITLATPTPVEKHREGSECSDMTQSELGLSKLHK